MTARTEVLEAARHLAGLSSQGTFTVAEVVRFLRQRGSRLAEGTIRTHVVSRMCVNAPHHHAVFFPDFVRVSRGVYRLSDDAGANHGTPEFSQREGPRARNPQQAEGHRSRGLETDWMALPILDTDRMGTEVDLGDLRDLGFVRLDLQFLGIEHLLASGPCSDWNCVGEVPDAAGVYAFVLERGAESPRVAYVGRTQHLWMVTKGSLPGGYARGGQRYGRPKHAGVTRERINSLVTAAARDGYLVSHWVCPVDGDASRLDAVEKTLIREWDLVAQGWNRR